LGRMPSICRLYCFFFQAEDGIRDRNVTGVQTCALPISIKKPSSLLISAHSSILTLRSSPSTDIQTSVVLLPFISTSTRKKSVSASTDSASSEIVFIILLNTIFCLQVQKKVRTSRRSLKAFKDSVNPQKKQPFLHQYLDRRNYVFTNWFIYSARVSLYWTRLKYRSPFFR